MCFSRIIVVLKSEKYIYIYRVYNRERVYITVALYNTNKR